MKVISTMLVLLATVCLGEVSLKNKDFSFEQKDSVETMPVTNQLVNKSLFNNLTAATPRSGTITGPARGEQANLWEPVTEIEDGAVYMIRCAENPNLYWDLTGGSTSNNTQVQLYSCNYSHAQKFYFRKQFDLDGNATYRLSPLYAYEKVLRFADKTENSILKIDDEKYTFSDNDMNLYSDKIYFTPSVNSGRFYAHTCFNNSHNTGKTYVSVQAAQSGNKIKTKDSSLPSNRFIYSWEIIKTDYVGLHVGNKTYINGTNESRYVVRVPYKGRYIIETQDYTTGANLDTFIRLVRDSDGVQILTADDISYPSNKNAKMTYNFQTIEEFSIYVKGFNSAVTGYVYVILRPEKTIYMSSVFDVGNNERDYTTPVNQSTPYLRNMGYFPIVQTNIHPDNLFYGQDWEGTRKVQRDYYIHRDHGSTRSAYYYDGDTIISVSSSALPSFAGTGVVAWIMCSGGNEQTGEPGHCPARQSVINGAQYSFGFRDAIYSISGDRFIKSFCNALQTKTLEDSIVYAAKEALANSPNASNDGIRLPSLFLKGGSLEYRYTITLGNGTCNPQIISY